MNINLRECEKLILTQKQIFTKNKTVSLEEHVLNELCISLDVIIIFSLFEIAMLISRWQIHVYDFCFTHPPQVTQNCKRLECNKIICV